MFRMFTITTAVLFVITGSFALMGQEEITMENWQKSCMEECTASDRNCSRIARSFSKLNVELVKRNAQLKKKRRVSVVTKSRIRAALRRIHPACPQAYGIHIKLVHPDSKYRTN